MYVMSGECPTYAAGGLVCRHELVTQSFSGPEGRGMKLGRQSAGLPPSPPVTWGAWGGGGGGSGTGELEVVCKIPLNFLDCVV